ncbi:hypothetical protein [Streptomyces sp. NPDC050560]
MSTLSGARAAVSHEVARPAPTWAAVTVTVTARHRPQTLRDDPQGSRS